MNSLLFNSRGDGMFAWLTGLIDSTDFMPHGACFLWLPSVLRLHVISDTIIALAYYSIPFALWYFVNRRADLAYRWVFVLFGVFIILCGTTHLLSIWTIWHPDYWLEGLIKSATALVSIITALLIWPLIPKLLLLPSPAVLQASEAYLRAIFDSAPDSILIINSEGIITMANQEVENLLGYQAGDLIGQSIEQLLPEQFRINHPELRNRFATAPFTRFMNENRSVKALKKSGEEVDVSIRLSPIKTPNGLFFASTLRDVTQEKQSEAALKASEERFRRMADASPAMIWITDSDGNPSFVNQTWRNFTGLDNEQALIHQEWLNLIHPDDRTAIFESYEMRIAVHLPIVTEYRMRRGFGDWRWILDHGVPMQDTNGDFCGFIGSAIDITERKQAEAEFRIAATAFESQEAMVITDTNAVILRVNKTFCDSTGYSANEVVGQKINFLKSGRHDRKFYAQMWDSILTTGVWQGEIWDKRKNGEIYPKWLTVTAVKDMAGVVTHYVGSHIDITEQKAAEDEIKHLAFFDPLTKLPNRRLLRDRLQQALIGSSRSKRFGAVFFIDLDNFKTLNDTLGHDMGDLLLLEVANRLTACVRSCDTVARLGGDEFVIMLEELGESKSEAAQYAEQIGQKIIALINQPYLLLGHEHHSSPSIGITLFGDNQETVDMLLKQSDIAMYQAKASGRNTLRFFSTSMQAAVTARAAMEDDLHKGLVEKQFSLNYQAQVDKAGSLIGCEALVRWTHPLRASVPPAEFISLAEETGLILPLGQWVLETACEQLAKWADVPEASQLSISVNVSVRQFKQTDFTAQVLSTIKRAGANPKRLKLELTESLLASDLDDIIAKMTALKQHGIGFALDDFGTGYSSLYYLKRLPLDQLKIDQSFVRNILTDLNDAAIAKVIIALSESLGFEVIAEGVETQAQLDFLAANGCNHFQGYLFNRPMPIEQFEAMLKNAGLKAKDVS